jgi:Uma2 family endonuclease
VTDDKLQVQKRPATYQDVIDAPEHLVAEIMDGELFLTARGAPLHARMLTRLASVLGPFVEGLGGPGGWEILNKPELHFASDVLVPDVAGWKLERMPELPADETFLTLAPDWVGEVLSPSTETIDRSRKLRIYARERVPHVWQVSAITGVLEVLRLDADRWSLVATHEGDEIVRVEPFEIIPIDLTRLWPKVGNAGPANGHA